MIDVFPQSPWLANTLVVCIGLSTAAVAYFPAMRWGWKVWPLVVLAALAVPVLIASLLTLGLPLVGNYIGLFGFSVHLKPLAVVGLLSALLGYTVALTFRRGRSSVR